MIFRIHLFEQESNYHIPKLSEEKILPAHLIGQMTKTNWMAASSPNLKTQNAMGCYKIDNSQLYGFKLIIYY